MLWQRQRAIGHGETSCRTIPSLLITPRRRLRSRFAPIFNVAVPFIDRHLSERRSEKVAIRTVAGDVTYGELAEQVNRCGNVLREMGLVSGDRLLMIVKDCPEFFYLFWGAIKAGIVPVPVNTLLRAPDYQYIIDDSACAAVVYSPEYAAEAAPALASASRSPGSLGDRRRRCRASSPAGTGHDDARCGRRHAGRRLLLALFVRLYRATERAPFTGIATLWSRVCTTRWIRWAWARGISVFPAAKLFFAYGLGNAMTFPLWVGATVVLNDQRPSPGDDLRSHRAF